MDDVLNYLLAWYNIGFTVPIAFVFLWMVLHSVAKRLDLRPRDTDIDRIKAGRVRGGSNGKGVVVQVSRFLNIGKAPFMIILMVLFSIWGISGLVVNGLLHVSTIPRFGLARSDTLGISFAIAFLCSVVGTRYIASGLSKLFFESEPALTSADLIGRTGRVISGRITTTFGTARVRIPNGVELTVSCRIRENDSLPLKGDTVVLFDYNPTTKIFDVTKADNGRSASGQRKANESRAKPESPPVHDV